MIGFRLCGVEVLCEDFFPASIPHSLIKLRIGGGGCDGRMPGWGEAYSSCPLVEELCGVRGRGTDCGFDRGLVVGHGLQLDKRGC